ncbi:MAG: DUF1343 domain-containing protein [Bacteroidales bacterium]|nr:DUF1343 domain-containing protein [Bacteroidales bacterium]
MRSVSAAILAATLCCACAPAGAAASRGGLSQESGAQVVVGAARPELYVPVLKGKRIALMSNQTGMVGDRHSLDVMLENGLDVRLIYSPEHGFRGTADAGEEVGSSVDGRTGIRIQSLYGSGEAIDLSDIDVVVVDIQDVGLRYYTYYVTMLKLMNKALEYGREFVIFDRPNPNGMYVDGPVLDMKYKSGVGGLPIPTVHGMTLGELALMAEGEGWLQNGGALTRLTVIPCANYTHRTRYVLPVAPSPNLPTMKSVYLYASLCFFEATPVSLGRGTDKPFQIYGHPDMTGPYDFTPESRPGAKEPPQKNRLCHGYDLSGLDDESILARGVNLEYLIDAYGQIGKDRPDFLSDFFELLIGRGDIRRMITDGVPARRIEASWRKDVRKFKKQRKPYLLYSE